MRTQLSEVSIGLAYMYFWGRKKLRKLFAFCYIFDCNFPPIFIVAMIGIWGVSQIHFSWWCCGEDCDSRKWGLTERKKSLEAFLMDSMFLKPLPVFLFLLFHFHCEMNKPPPSYVSINLLICPNTWNKAITDKPFKTVRQTKRNQTKTNNNENPKLLLWDSLSGILVRHNRQK